MVSNAKRRQIVLFHPDYQPGDYGTLQHQPLDIMSVSGFPEREGYRVIIVDASVSRDYRDRVLEACDDALCFGTTSILGYPAYHSYTIAKEVKAKYPDLPVIAGGWFPSVKPEMVIAEGAADIVVIGQGERTFMELLEAIESASSLEGIEGLAYRNGDEIVINPPRAIEDINKMPAMPYHLINFDDYFARDSFERAKQFLRLSSGKDFSSTKIRALDYFSSYGCPDNCTFCSSPTVTGRRWTGLEAARIVNELGFLVKKHNFNILTFCEANWGVSEKRVIELCEGLLEEGIAVSWMATMEASFINQFGAKVMDLMAESGCIGLSIGAEAAHPETLRCLRKNIKREDIFQSIEICTRSGIVPQVGYILGYPGEDEESIRATIDDVCEIAYRWPKVEIIPKPLYPIPGTPIHEKAVEMGYQSVTSIEELSEYRDRMTEFNPFISPEQLRVLRRCRQYYIRWGSELLSVKWKLNLLEKILNRISRIRLKHRLLGFPIEYKLYEILLRLYNKFASGLTEHHRS